MKINEIITESFRDHLDNDDALDEARKRKKKKSKKRRPSSNRSPVPRFYGAWGFGDSEGGGDGGGE